MYVGVTGKYLEYVGVQNISGHSRGRCSIFTLKIVLVALMNYFRI